MKTKLYKNRELTLKICLSAMCLALVFVLPFITGSNPELGNMLCPMHIPALLMGIIIGPYFGGALAFVSPILRSLIIGSPSLFPRAVTMSFELMGYAFVFGFIYMILKKGLPELYISLVGGMLAGRIVGCLFKLALYKTGAMGAFNLPVILSGYFVETIPAIVIQILLIPPIVLALRKAKIIK